MIRLSPLRLSRCVTITQASARNAPVTSRVRPGAESVPTSSTQLNSRRNITSSKTGNQLLNSEAVDKEPESLVRHIGEASPQGKADVFERAGVEAPHKENAVAETQIDDKGDILVADTAHSSIEKDLNIDESRIGGVAHGQADVQVNEVNELELAASSSVSKKPQDDVEEPYWQKIPLWMGVSKEEFLKYSWQLANTVQGEKKLVRFLNAVLPETLPPNPTSEFAAITTRELYIQDVLDGIALAPMAIRLTPHTLSVVDWSNPFDDPIRKQFLPMKSSILEDHPKLKLDSLHEEGDNKVKGLVHRYPDKALFLDGTQLQADFTSTTKATSACPVYCRFCTRSYAIGPETTTVTKNSLKPSKSRWEAMFEYIASTPSLQDIVVSGGDSYYLTAAQLLSIGERLLAIPHIKRFRFASKGLAVCPSRILDEGDEWMGALVEVARRGREVGKAVALHTHFNHPDEVTWVTRRAARRLFAEGVMVRNQSVLLRGVNDSVEIMGELIRRLADSNIFPYYVYQGDMVKGVEDLRTPLSTILHLEEQLRGSIAGFMMPSFVVDLPGGGGKRLAASYKTYNRVTGESTFVAPAVGKGVDTVFSYWDPVGSLIKNDASEVFSREGEQV